MWSAIDRPAGRREYSSVTVARYRNRPSSPSSARAAVSPLSGSAAARGFTRSGYFSIWRAITMRWIWLVPS
ncbi:hypothetical protein HDA32_003218 [Spinactinospora alkalitolerans]|uniref:Uncharacterized protein n=1 Tax=Spinactinospora alkalitolerans TaxID=687207 RepID=A0A852TVZ0_9ACTN|nr:hypothetical protein [Spinactinospora alkalitolerans]